MPRRSITGRAKGLRSTRRGPPAEAGGGTVEAAATPELRPCRECCGTDLPPASPEVRFGSHECTFCRACAEGVLAGRCPNCGGELVRRPIRAAERLLRHPASTVRRVRPGCCAAA